MSFNEKEFSVRGLRLRAKHWHENAPHKVIALHGWLDNAASFDVLAPLLPECSIAALDLAGQGFSEHRPPSATYHLWDDLVDILDIADQLGWQRFSVIGHSRGGMLAIMLAASVSERVERIILLDALMPAPVEPGNAPQQLRRHLLESRPRESRWFASREQAIAVRARASAIPEAVAEMLASRQLCQSVQGWFWKIDERLKAASALKLSAEHNRAFLAAVQCPATVILASGGWLAPYWQQLARDYPQFSWHVLDGHHHLHMDQQAGEVACLCLRV